jgi:hypothetical protein
MVALSTLYGEMIVALTLREVEAIALANVVWS